MTLIFLKNKTRQFLILLQFLSLPIQAQFTETIQSLEEYNRKTRNELVFLHIDREIYYPGDTLWFKAYVRNQASLQKSSLSRDLFVYLVDEKGDVIQDAKFLIKNSGVKGHLALDRDLQKGNYYVVAYSSWMQNFEIEKVFKKRIHIKYLNKESYELIPSYDKKAYFPGDTVYMQIKCYDQLRREEKNVGFAYKVSTGDSKIARGNVNALNGYDNSIRFTVPDTIQGPCMLELWGDHKLVELDRTYKLPVHFTVSMDFFPEGGQALNGIMNRIAFKATYPNGMPAKIEGEIIGGKGKVMKTVASRHNGMGSFPLIPKKGKAYYLKITKPSGTDQQFQLPRGKDRGWHLSARNNQNQVYVQIQKRNLPTDTCLITLMIREQMIYSKVMGVEKTKTLTIPTDTLPSGIGVITLFDKNLLPRAERLVFVNYHRRQQVTMTTNKERYEPREKVILNIKVTGPANKPIEGEYSLAVVDQKLGLSGKIKNTSVFSASWFSPEIKGRVINPGYYFNTGSRQERYHLDLLLMTQGWRNYKYLEKVKDMESLPEPVNQDVISGQILKKRSIFDPRPTQGKVNVYFGGVSKTVHTDNQGRFSFRPVFDGVNPNIFLSATNSLGEDDVIIRLDSNRFKQKLLNNMPSLIDSLDQRYVSPVQTHASLEKLYEWVRLNHFLIEPVTVTAKGPKKEKRIRQRLINNMPDKYKKRATQSDIEENENVYDILLDMKKDQDLPIRYNIKTNMMEYLYLGKWVPITWYVDGFKWRDDPRNIYTGVIKDLKLLVGDIPTYLFERPHNLSDISFRDDPMKYAAKSVAHITTDSTQYQSRVQAYKMANRKELPRYTFTKEFYKPVYDTAKKKEDPQPDLRKTIHWEPNVQLDLSGRGIVTFYNADQYTNIRCILQGISDNGIPVYGNTGYKVSLIKQKNEQ